MAPKAKNCYVWMDYCCANQNKNAEEVVEHLDKIIESCDCLFTPIVDEEMLVMPSELTNVYTEYRAKAFNQGSRAYLNRRWCRIEMLLSANIPILPSNNPQIPRHSQFAGALKFNASHGRRPHFLYGSYESKNGSNPIVLPLLQSSEFSRFNPEEGFLTSADDEAITNKLIDVVRATTKQITEGYEGGRDDQGKRSGHGVYTYASGAEFDGEWVDGKKQGNGEYRYPNGDVCKGTWKSDQIHGNVVYYFHDGAVYSGGFVNGALSGRGVYK